MRYFLLLLLVAAAVALVLHMGAGQRADAVRESIAVLDKAQSALLPAQLQQVAAALDAFADDRGSWPESLPELIPEFLPRRDLIIDPWGTELRLERGGDGGLYLACAGPDRVFASPDDKRRSL